MKAGLAVRLCIAVAACGVGLAAQDDFAAHLRGAVQLHQKRDYASAEKLLLAALKEAESFGPEDRRTVVALNNLGSAYHHLDRYWEAERRYRRALDICKKVCGPDDTLLARISVNLASLYLDSRQYAKAEHLGLRSLTTRPTLKRPEVARLVGILGALAEAQGLHSEAEHYYKQALESWEKLGPESYDAMQTLSNLGAMYGRTGRDAEALDCCERALRIAEKTLSPGHPTRAVLLSNVGALHYAVHGPSEAEAFFKRALATAETTLGPQHPLVGEILSSHAVVLEQTKRKAEAKEYQRRARAIMQAASREDVSRYTVDVRDLRRRKSPPE
jgi:tetratricopeptide (TPR) repeat protein